MKPTPVGKFQIDLGEIVVVENLAFIIDQLTHLEADLISFEIDDTTDLIYLVGYNSITPTHPSQTHSAENNPNP